MPSHALGRGERVCCVTGSRDLARDAPRPRSRLTFAAPTPVNVKFALRTTGRLSLPHQTRARTDERRAKPTRSPLPSKTRPAVRASAAEGPGRLQPAVEPELLGAASGGSGERGRAPGAVSLAADVTTFGGRRAGALCGISNR